MTKAGKVVISGAEAVAIPLGQSTPMLQRIRLSALRFGHEHPDGSINARKYGRGDADDLKPSLAAHGVIIPLVVKRGDGVDGGEFCYVVEGNRRLAGMLELTPTAKRADVLIPTIELGQGDALEMSVILNSQRKDLHPVDRFEVFEVLIKAGASIEDVAARHLMKPAQVRQALSLARLAPEVRAAWRAGAIAGDHAEAFALTSDHAVQAKLLKKLGKNVTSWQVKRELGADDHEVTHLLKFVSAAAYEAAGHHVNATLFGDRDTVSDVGALKMMASEMVNAECARLVTAGWAWAIPKAQAPGDLHAWRRVYPTKGMVFAKDAMAAAGCVVDVGHDGKLEVARGHVKPGDKVKLPKGATTSPEQRKEREKAKQRAEDGPVVSNALAERLSRQMTLAVADVLVAHPDHALCVAIAALACASSPTRVRVGNDWQVNKNDWRKLDGRDDNDFGKYLMLAISKTPAERMGLLAHWVAQAVDATCAKADALPLAKDTSNPAAGALLRAMPEKPIAMALFERFDEDDYFASMARDVGRQAVLECGEVTTLVGDKASMVKHAATVANSHGWLPPEMRTAGYEGPRAKTAAPAPKKKSGKIVADKPRPASDFKNKTNKSKPKRKW
jgi:ParB/RepB/Spo0J family partition protein